MHIVMIAAENGALLGGKVGGIGDVIRDVPKALAARGQQVSVLTPGYQALSRLNPSVLLCTVSVRFCGQLETLELFAVQGRDATSSSLPATSTSAVTHYVLEHPLFAACGAGSIYCNDHYGPFATDAHKFSLFCAAVAQLLLESRLGPVDVLHLHDWHAAMLAILRAFVPEFSALRRLPVVYSIHNLSLQGIRPLAGDASSLQSWFPDLVPAPDTIQDPDYHDCVNLMRAGINLADKVHVVSPSYAREILLPTDAARGFIGGERLERDLQRVVAQKRLQGILNGCDYGKPPSAALTRVQLLDLIESTLLDWVGDKLYVPAAHFYAQRRLAEWRKRRRPISVTLTSVGRLTAQKVRLLREQLPNRKGGESAVVESALIESTAIETTAIETTAIERLLHELGDGIFILIGSGDEDYEAFFTAVMARCDNFLFLRGFSEPLADALYAQGDLFLMPSSYEPCGISQMLAMRAGTPCIVHHVGGLKDTVRHGINGFSFSGQTSTRQAENMLETVRSACATMAAPEQWQSICHAAAASRFSWDESAEHYLTELYS